MRSDSPVAAGADASFGDDPLADARPRRVHLLMAAGSPRERFADALGGRYAVTASDEATAAAAASDLCLVDDAGFAAAADEVAAYRARADVFFPVLFVPPADDPDPPAEVWTHVDDVVRADATARELRARVRTLLRQRAAATRLSAHGRVLAETTAELHLLKRTADAAPNGVTILEMTADGATIEYANDAFEALTGYAEADVADRGLDCLFGAATHDDDVARVHAAIDAGDAVSATFINYRRDGTQFWNRLDAAPAVDDDRVTHYVCFHTDVTADKVREQRLGVFNRLMRHNLRNDLNVVIGYADILRERNDDPDDRSALTEIRRGAKKLERLGRHAGRVERILDRIHEHTHVRDLDGLLTDLADDYRAECPDVDLVVTVADGPWPVHASGLPAVFRELFDNAVENTNQAAPRIEVTVAPAPTDPDRVRVEVADNGPGIPQSITSVLHRGEETPLHHGDGLGIWLVYWATTLLGGDVSFTGGTDGTTVALTFPVVDD